MEVGAVHVPLFTSELAWHGQCTHLAIPCLESWGREVCCRDQRGQADVPRLRGAPGPIWARCHPGQLLLLSLLGRA